MQSDRPFRLSCRSPLSQKSAHVSAGEVMSSLPLGPRTAKQVSLKSPLLRVTDQELFALFGGTASSKR